MKDLSHLSIVNHVLLLLLVLLLLPHAPVHQHRLGVVVELEPDHPGVRVEAQPAGVEVLGRVVVEHEEEPVHPQEFKFESNSNQIFNFALQHTTVHDRFSKFRHVCTKKYNYI